jgi:DNA-binding HxlR family transcriptional regulator
MKQQSSQLKSSERREIGQQYVARIETVVGVLRGRWTIQVLCAMRDKPVRLSELRRLIPSASKKGLTASLRSLEIMGLITRHDLSDVILHVEYEIATPMRLVVLSLLDYLATCDLPVSRTRTEIDRQVVDVS